MSQHSPRQMALDVHLTDDATFANFFIAPGSVNQQAVQMLEAMLAANSAERFVYLWGTEGSGLSHLLQAVCHRSEELNLVSQYLPLEDLAGYAAEELLEGLEQLDVLCLDGVDTVMGQSGWDEAMFNLYNRMREKNCRMVVSANCPPVSLGNHLPDLVSRMGWGVVYHLQQLSDDEKHQALIFRAARKGLELSDEVAAFILARGARSMEELFQLLETLDRASLAEQRRLTIPFIKQTLRF